jgi:miniconductance mechanosensitive channel
MLVKVMSNTPTSPIETFLTFESMPQIVSTLTGLLALLLAAWIMNSVVKRLILRGLQSALKHTAYGKDPALTKHGFIERLANIMPALVITSGISLVPYLSETVVTVVHNVASAFIVMTLALAVSAALNIVNTIYSRRADAGIKPIKGYIQVAKLLIFIITTVLIVATLIDRSPIVLLSGIGAMAAVLMLVFQDTLLSLVASIQLSSSDMIRVGDWIEMPQLNADGDVIDIALHTVKVQNWDKTITTIPTRKLVTDPFKNWRGMQESGGRRIKRSIYLDQNSIRFMNQEERNKLRRFNILKDYLDTKEKEITEWNSQLSEGDNDLVNTRRITNIGTFRAYIDKYLRSHKGINQNMTLIVRQLSPTPEGLPLEIYCFTATTAWVGYESTQSDIFDHLLAILPEFGLQVFQNPSGGDFRQIAAK